MAQADMQLRMAREDLFRHGVKLTERCIAAVSVEPAVFLGEGRRLFVVPEGRGIADVPENGCAALFQLRKHGVELLGRKIHALFLKDGGLGLDELDTVRASVQPIYDVCAVVLTGVYQPGKEIAALGVGALDRQAVIVVLRVEEGIHAGKA